MTQRRTVVLLLLALAASVYVGQRWLLPPDRKLNASGVLEARNINVGSKVGGRIREVLVREGDHVRTGEVLVRFDDAEQAARVEQARGKLALARANLDKMEHGSRIEDIAEARAATGTPQAGPGYRRAEVAAARAALARAKADATHAEVEFRRAEALLVRHDVSRQAYDDAAARLAMAKEQVATLAHDLSAADGRLQAAEAVTQRTETGFRNEDIAAARADLVAAEGQLHEMEASWREHEVKAPADATIEVLDLRPGHLLQPNAIVAKLLEDAQLFVMVYVPEPRIGQVRLGQKAEVRTDAFPDQTFAATVEQIRQKAEFLPRNVQTLEERVHQVIGVKLRIDNSDHRLRAGVHADVRFLDGQP